jgi:hypothetical protein
LNLPFGSGACDDGNSCTTGDVCSFGSCSGMPLPDGTVCDDAGNIGCCAAAMCCLGPGCGC